MADHGDHDTVCSMCGDVGFPDKLFQCSRCLSRFQHSYCSNYYDEQPMAAAAGVCDWCLSEERSGARHHKKAAGRSDSRHSGRSEYPVGDRVKQSGEREESAATRGKSSGSSSSSKPAGRRYKLLKDVLC